MKTCFSTVAQEIIRMLSIIVVCAPMLAFADGVIQFPQGPTVLKYTPCVSEKVLTLIPPELHSRFKAAAMMWEGKPYEACWVQPGGMTKDVYLIAEDGSSGIVPRRLIAFDLEV